MRVVRETYLGAVVLRRELEWRSDGYEFISDLPVNLRRWEFLRRNPEYQREWREELAAFMSRVAVDSLDPDDRPEAPWFCIPSQHCRESWFLSAYVDPRLDEQWASSVWVDQMPPRFFAANPRGAEPPPMPERADLTGDHVVYLLDLRDPIEPQVDHLRRSARTYQRLREQFSGLKVRRQARAAQKWPLYLRILDGLAELDGDSSLTGQQLLDGLELGLGVDLDRRTLESKVRAARALTTPHGDGKHPGYLRV